MSLASRFHDGDQSVVADVLRDLGPALRLRLSRKYPELRACGEVEQVLLDAFARGWQRHRQFDEQKGELGAWLATIADHLAIDFIRTASGHDGTVELVVAPETLRKFPSPPPGETG